MNSRIRSKRCKASRDLLVIFFFPTRKLDLSVLFSQVCGVEKSACLNDFAEVCVRVYAHFGKKTLLPNPFAHWVCRGKNILELRNAPGLDTCVSSQELPYTRIFAEFVHLFR